MPGQHTNMVRRINAHALKGLLNRQEPGWRQNPCKFLLHQASHTGRMPGLARAAKIFTLDIVRPVLDDAFGDTLQDLSVTCNKIKALLPAPLRALQTPVHKAEQQGPYDIGADFPDGFVPVVIPHTLQV